MSENYIQAQWAGSPITLNSIYRDGNVGIGTTIPNYKLQVNGAGLNGEVASFDNQGYSTMLLTGATPGAYNLLTAANDNGIIWHNDSSTPTNGFVIAPWANSTAGMRIDGLTGNVGIGVSAATSKLELDGGILGQTTGDQKKWMSLHGTSNNTEYLNIFQNRHSNGTDWNSSEVKIQKVVDVTPMHYISFKGDTGFNPTLNFGYGDGINATNHMTIKQNGNLGIGTNNPLYQLHVNGTGLNGEVASFDNQGYSTMLLTGATPGAYNNLTAANDNGIIWHNDSSTPTSGFVIAPWVNSTAGMRITKNGNIGIGISSPHTKLDVNGNLLIRGTNNFTNHGDEAIVHLGGKHNSIRVKRDTGVSINTFTFIGDTRLPEERGIFLQEKTGNVGIGTDLKSNTYKNIPDYYRLSVDGSVRAKGVVVETNWADFVFEKNYLLKPLKEVEQYIKENGHLPEIPSAKDIEQNGANVGDLLKLQMQKIEELTLYILEQEKRIKTIEKQLNSK